MHYQKIFYSKVSKSEINYLNLNHMRTLAHGFVVVQTWFILVN